MAVSNRKNPLKPIPCPACGSIRNDIFYVLAGIPVHSVLLVPTRAEALEFPRGDLRLAFCQDCGFIFNSAFDPARLAYSSRYEETQGFSPTFNAFHQRLAQHLIDRYDLRRKMVVEIGCGKGEFLTLLCELGENQGIGFDPAYVPGRTRSPASERLTFITDFYSEKYAGYRGDFYCCKMTLEHIQHPLEFVSTLRRAIGDRQEAIVFFQVPDTTRILDERAFWDIYYEHCSYFTAGSLKRLFRRSGFEVLDLWTGYDDQYLMIEARPGSFPTANGAVPDDDLEDLARKVRQFSADVRALRQGWEIRLKELHKNGRRVVVWGGGSKGVAFLTTLQAANEIICAVDINPHKHGTFMAGSGHPIVSPAQLPEIKPDLVVVMNPIYCQEIADQLAEMGLAPELVSIDAAI